MKGWATPTRIRDGDTKGRALKLAGHGKLKRLSLEIQERKRNLRHRRLKVGIEELGLLRVHRSRLV